MVKKLMTLAAMLAMVLLAAIPALAQHSDRAADQDVGAGVDVDRASERAAGNSAVPVPAPANSGPEDADSSDFVAVPKRGGGDSVVPAPDASGGGSR